MTKCKSKKAGDKKTGTFKPQIVFPMYPYRNPVGAAGTCLALTPEAANIPQYVLDKDDIAILKSATPEVFVRDSDGRTTMDYVLLEGILIGEYNIRPADTKDLSKRQILSMLKSVQRKKGSGNEKTTGGEQTTDKPTDNNWHNEDFTEVLWNGQKYTFNKTQALVVEYLWNNRRGSEKTIGEKLESDNQNYRLRHTFREKKKGKTKMHPAFDKMIVSDGKGIYALNEKTKNPPKK